MLRKTTFPTKHLSGHTSIPEVLILVILISLVLVSCTIGQPQIPSKDWQLHWLQGVPCRAPCWEGITPGKTNVTQTMEILSHIPSLTNLDKRNDSKPSELGRLSWDWKNGNKGGYVYYSPSNETISIVAPIFDAWFSFHDVLQTYGEPSHITAWIYQSPDVSSKNYHMVLVYLSQGFEIWGNQLTKPNLNEDMLFNQVMFFEPTREQLEASDGTAKQHPDWLIPWQGFKGFDYYCRDEQNGKYCRGEK